MFQYLNKPPFHKRRNQPTSWGHKGRCGVTGIATWVWHWSEPSLIATVTPLSQSPLPLPPPLLQLLIPRCPFHSETLKGMQSFPRGGPQRQSSSIFPWPRGLAGLPVGASRPADRLGFPSSDGVLPEPGWGPCNQKQMCSRGIHPELWG